MAVGRRSIAHYTERMNSPVATRTLDSDQLTKLAVKIKEWGIELGFQEVGIAPIELSADAHYLDVWLAQKFHGEMAYMERHGQKRSRPDELIAGTLRAISARLNYWPDEA